MGTRLHLDVATGRYELEEPSHSSSLRLAMWFIALFGIVGLTAATLSVNRWTRAGSAAQSPRTYEPPLLNRDFNRPRLGQVRIGAYAGEAAQVAGLTASSIPALSDIDRYRVYRQSIRDSYGADLEEMNYFSIGTDGWSQRLPMLRTWLLRAGMFGEVTIGLEPSGPDTYDVFKDSPEMRELRSIFREAESRGVRVVIRFASEANLMNSPYSAYGSVEQSSEHFRAAVWFKSYMPESVVLVFSPLINTAVAGEIPQKKAIEVMFGGPTPGEQLPWDRIGGTIYRTNVRLAPTFSAYYRMMSRLDDVLPFQICEVGGPYSRRAEVKAFLADLSRGRWPRVKKVNLFARDINRRADPNGSFGFMNPHERAIAAEQAAALRQPQRVESYLYPMFSNARSGEDQ